jgi:uncharacterized RDD family membrane protein YckC
MFCTKCGSLAPEGARFCRTCGQPLEAPAGAAAEAALVAAPVPRAGPGPAATAAGPEFAAPPVAAYISPLGAVALASPLPAPYAGFWLRLVAYLIDSAIVTVAFGAIIAMVMATVGLRFFRGFTPQLYERPVNPLFPAALLGTILVLLPITIAVTWIYFAALESSAHQATLGKMALGLLVTDQQGQRVSFGRASGRFFAKIITGLIPFFIGYIMAGFTEKKQALHDMIAGCLVLKKI